MTSLPNHDLGPVVAELAEVIVANKAYLSEIDGAIGDGDHGINMAKGFGRAAERLSGKDVTLDEGFAVLSDILLSEIGGSMGPLYGLMFEDMAGALKGRERIGAADVSLMLHAGLEGIRGVGGAAVGDKTLMDTLVPAVAAFDAAKGEGLEPALQAMAQAAETGRDSTIDLVAKIGRASRLGERSRGVLDAGATSCCLILMTLAASITRRLA